jgi:hypothetical protein
MNDVRKRLKHWYITECGDECKYCGDVATQMDHTYPVSVLNVEIEVYKWLSVWGVPYKIRKHLNVVPSCAQCNNWLSNQRYFGVGRRREYIAEKIERKYKKYLKIVQFSDEELDEFGENLKNHLKRSQTTSERVRDRWFYAKHGRNRYA